MSKLRKYKIFFFAFIVLFGFFYRLYLASFSYSTLVFDMLAYSRYARDILRGVWPISCCIQNVGYSVFLAGVYSLFGIDNIFAVRLIQVLLDLVTALIVYLIGKSIFGSKTAFISFVLYIINPFTSSYTGLVLAETVTLLFVSLIAYILHISAFLKRPALWLILGILLGLLLFTRHSFYYFSLVFILLLSFMVGKGVKRLKFILITLIGFLLASSYSLIGYYRNYHVISLVPPYSFMAGILYSDFFLGKYPEVEFHGIAPEYTQMAVEFNNTPLQDKKKYSQKYTALFWQKMKTDWPIFIKNISRNMFWIWDKDHLYTYVDPFYPSDRWVLRILNLGILGFSIVGIIKYIRRIKCAFQKNLVLLLTVALMLYITFVFTLVSNESRHSLAVYSLVMLWAGYGLVETITFLKRRMRKR